MFNTKKGKRKKLRATPLPFYRILMFSFCCFAYKTWHKNMVVTVSVRQRFLLRKQPNIDACKKAEAKMVRTKKLNEYYVCIFGFCEINKKARFLLFPSILQEVL